MKRFFLIALCCLFAVNTMYGTDVEVSNIDEFYSAVLENASAHIQLTGNIYTTELPCPIPTTFKGTINGQGKDAEGNDIAYTIGGIGPKDGRAQYPLFAGVDGATFTNVVFSQYRLESSDDGLGAVASSVSNATFAQVGFVAVSVYEKDDVAGVIAGTAINCTLEHVRITSCDVTVDGDHVGGLFGNSEKCQFTDCTTSINTKIFADGNGVNAYAGGMVGESKEDTFKECVNLGMVGGNDNRVGGITGYSDNSHFIGCINSGYVCHVTEEEFGTSTESILSRIQENIETYETKMEYTTYLMATGFGLMLATWPLVGLSPLAAGVSFVAGVGVMLVTIVYASLFVWQGHDELGGIAGYAQKGYFSSCSNYGCCYGIDQYVGGIVGQAPGTFYSEGVGVSNCLNAGAVHGGSHVGGIVGSMEDSGLNNCLNVGDVMGANGNYVGELFGDQKNCSWNNNYFRGNRYDKESGGRICVTDAQLNSGIVAWWLNNGLTNGPWRQNIGGENPDQWPTLDDTHAMVTDATFADSYAIGTADELMAFAETVNNRTTADKSFVAYLTDDIDMTGKTWEPIGTQSMPFYGLFFGGSHTIDNLTCNVDHSDAGIFGTVGLRTEIHNVILGEHSSISSLGNAVGGIVGCVRVPDKNIGTVKVIGCGNNAPITGKFNVGGIVGAVYNDQNLQLEITDCFNRGRITAFLPQSGTSTGESAAICGYAKNYAAITRCWNTGDVVGEYANGQGVTFQGYVSGMFFVYGNGPIITDCYNCADVNTNGRSQTDVKSFTTEELADGSLAYLLNGKFNNARTGTSSYIHWQQNIDGSQPHPVPGYRGVFYSRTITPREDASDTTPYYGTICLPFTVASSDELKFFTLDGSTSENAICFTSVDKLQAGKPAVFRSYSAGTLPFFSCSNDFTTTPSSLMSDDGEWNMEGNLNPTTSLVFTNDNEYMSKLYYISGGMVRQATQSLTVGPYRAYLRNNNMLSSSQAISVRFDDEDVTAIAWKAADETVNANGNGNANAVYDLQGRRVDNPQRGIYIINGKKTLIK